jgi:hypothetical protein
MWLVEWRVPLEVHDVSRFGCYAKILKVPLHLQIAIIWECDWFKVVFP